MDAELRNIRTSELRNIRTDFTSSDRAILEFESQHPRNDRSKEAAIRNTFGYSWVRYQQKLMRLTTNQDAVAAYPMAVARVVRVSRRNGLRTF